MDNRHQGALYKGVERHLLEETGMASQLLEMNRSGSLEDDFKHTQSSDRSPFHSCWFFPSNAFLPSWLSSPSIAWWSWPIPRPPGWVPVPWRGDHAQPQTQIQPVQGGQEGDHHVSSLLLSPPLLTNAFYIRHTLLTPVVLFVSHTNKGLKVSYLYQLSWNTYSIT